MFENNIFYKLGKINKSKKYTILYPLFLPYVIILSLYIVFCFESFIKCDPVFFWILQLGMVVFIFEPKLLYKYMDSFLSFKTDESVCFEMQQYFTRNEEQLYGLYIKIWKCESVLSILIGVLPIILCPSILSKNITNGSNDLFFWLIIVFLIWFLMYCSNAPAFITLFTIKIIPDLISDKIVPYNLFSKKYHYSINAILVLCRKAISYSCLALFFLPLAIYFLLQPQTILNEISNLHIKFSPINIPMHIIWTTCLLIIYASFLLFFISFPKKQIKKYIKQKNNKMIIDESTNYLISHNNCLSQHSIKNQFRELNSYFYLQETKAFCSFVFEFNTEDTITYISAIASIISAIPGLVQIISYI